MSTKNTSTGSNNTAFSFDPASLAQYHSNLSTVMPWLQNNVSNPFGTDAFAKENALSQDQAAQVGQRMKSNVLNNAAALGYGTNGALFNDMIARAGRTTSGLQAQGFRSAVGNALNRQMGSAQMLSAFQPLMTGSNGNFTNTQTTSGLGTWLPQLIGAGVGMATNAFMPGASAATGAAASAAPSSGWNWNNGIIGSIPGVTNVPGSIPNLFPPTSATPYGYGTH